VPNPKRSQKCNSWALKARQSEVTLVMGRMHLGGQAIVVIIDDANHALKLQFCRKFFFSDFKLNYKKINRLKNMLLKICDLKT
jgi:hypothetical protein